MPDRYHAGRLISENAPDEPRREAIKHPVAELRVSARPYGPRKAARPCEARM